MGRPVPTAFFLVDTSFPADAKFRALARRLTDPDDYNSAVGAYFVALAASRRRGSPVLDVVEETATRFQGDLIAVGLWSATGFPSKTWAAWAAMSPQQASAGRARAEQAERDNAGRFLPADPADASALGDPSSGVQPSPPPPSSPLLSNGGGSGGRLEDTTVLYHRITGSIPKGHALSWLNRLDQLHGSAKVQTAIIAQYTKDSNLGDFLGRVEATLVGTGFHSPRGRRNDYDALAVKA